MSSHTSHTPHTAHHTHLTHFSPHTHLTPHLTHLTHHPSHLTHLTYFSPHTPPHTPPLTHIFTCTSHTPSKISHTYHTLPHTPPHTPLQSTLGEDVVSILPHLILASMFGLTAYIVSIIDLYHFACIPLLIPTLSNHLTPFYSLQQLFNTLLSNIKPNFTL